MMYCIKFDWSLDLPFPNNIDYRLTIGHSKMWSDIEVQTYGEVQRFNCPVKFRPMVLGQFLHCARGLRRQSILNIEPNSRGIRIEKNGTRFHHLDVANSVNFIMTPQNCEGRNPGPLEGASWFKLSLGQSGAAFLMGMWSWYVLVLWWALPSLVRPCSLSCSLANGYSFISSVRNRVDGWPIGPINI